MIWARIRRPVRWGIRGKMRDHTDVRCVWFNGDMYIEGRVEGVQMPRQPLFWAGYARRANQWTQVCQVPPLPTSSQVRGPFPVGEGLLHVWPVTRSVTRTVTRDVSAVALRLILGRNATGRDIRDAIAGSRPGGPTTSLRQGFIRRRLTQGGGNAHTCASLLDGSRAHYLHD
jgi:hypothetical protein